MVQKQPPAVVPTPPRRRGRPRGFETAAALTQALDVFWQSGFAAASLDDLSSATGLNRPSLYGAFGDKRALYLQAYRHYRQLVRETFAPLFVVDAPLRPKLRRILLAAVDFYLGGGESGPRGCFTVISAASEAIADPDLRAIVVEAIDNSDRGFARLFADARAKGELPETADPRSLARLATATLQTLSIRARAHTPRETLVELADDAVATLCGPDRGEKTDT